MAKAEKSTVVPGQIVVDEALMFTEGVTISFTVIVISLLVALFGKAQIAFEVNITLTLFVLTSELLENVELLAPTTSDPFICH